MSPQHLSGQGFVYFRWWSSWVHMDSTSEAYSVEQIGILVTIKFSKKTQTQQENRKLNVRFQNGGIKQNKTKTKKQTNNSEFREIKQWKNLLPEGIYCS